MANGLRLVWLEEAINLRAGERYHVDHSDEAVFGGIFNYSNPNDGYLGCTDVASSNENNPAKIYINMAFDLDPVASYLTAVHEKAHLTGSPNLIDRVIEREEDADCLGFSSLVEDLGHDLAFKVYRTCETKCTIAGMSEEEEIIRALEHSQNPGLRLVASRYRKEVSQNAPDLVELNRAVSELQIMLNEPIKTVGSIQEANTEISRLKAKTVTRGAETYQGEISFEDQIQAVKDAFDAQFNPTDLMGNRPAAERWVIEVYNDKVLVRWDPEKAFVIPYTVNGQAINFAGPDKWVKIEHAWVPVTEAVRVTESKGKEPADKGLEWAVTIIGPETANDLITDGAGSYIRSQNGRLYSCAALEASVPLFQDTKVYDNHLTDKQLRETHGMRSVVRELVGVIVDPTWNKAKNAIIGTLKVIDEALRNKLILANEANVLDTFGLSIDALCEGKPVNMGGQNMTLIEQIGKVLSVDIVANPAAGGRLSRMIACMGSLQK
jgi:hypothetical protein